MILFIWIERIGEEVIVMCYIIGVILLVIGVDILVFGDTDIVSTVWGWISVTLGMLMIITVLSDINENKTINGNSIEIETVTETQSVKTSDIKVAILNKYNGAEIISSDKPDKGYFIYEQEKYSYELDDNILFISKGNKIVDYLYVN